MPSRLARPCRYQGCPNLTHDHSGYCLAHLKESRQAQDQARGSASERGCDSRWYKARKVYLGEHPLCVKCLDEGRVTMANCIDHIQPHRGDKRLFWDTSNWQALCTRHHSMKTTTEDGAFGNRAKAEAARTQQG